MISSCILLAVFVGLAAALPATPYGAPSVQVPLVINGEVAPEGAWPSQLSLRRLRDDGWGHTCGATLLDEYWALTAAHCVDGAAPHERQIQAGVNRRDDPNGQIVEVSTIIMHEDYSTMFGYPNDVAVVKFKTPIRFNDRVQPGNLPEPNEDFVNQECYISGWGRTDSTNNIPNELRQGKVDVLTKSDCSSKTAFIRDSHICILDANKVHGACNGDSGGPIHCRANSSSPYKQVGVASWVSAFAGRCLVGRPSVYGRISHHLDWIRNNAQ